MGPASVLEGALGGVVNDAFYGSYGERDLGSGLEEREGVRVWREKTPQGGVCFLDRGRQAGTDRDFSGDLGLLFEGSYGEGRDGGVDPPQVGQPKAYDFSGAQAGVEQE